MVGYLVLENGEIFEGDRIGSIKDVYCEVVFNTSTTGYTEIFTDPSYYGQGIVMTYPIIGSFGVINEDFESNKIYASAIIVHDLSEFESNHRSIYSVEKWLRANNVPGLTNVDTRRLTKVLKENGTMNGYITSNISNLSQLKKNISDYKIINPIEKVSSQKVSVYGRGKPKRVVVIDYGFKHGIVNNLLKCNVEVVIFPSRARNTDILQVNPNAIVLSNGPGNPENCKDEIKTLKDLCEEDIPIFGIGLGHNLMALANGFKSAKLKYGHRGQNFPVKELNTGKIYMTSQNQGYHILESSVDTKIAKISYVDLNEGIVEGLDYINKRIKTVGFNPEACPGPEDMIYLFRDFINKI